MDRRQINVLLNRASLIDNRIVLDPVIDLWEELLGHIDFQDALWALDQHRLTQAGKYFEPGSVIEQLRLRRQSVALKPIDPPMCHLHLNYPLPCNRCHQDMLEHGAIQPVVMRDLGELTAPIGRTP
ncbi:MAG: hypothetical protein ABJB33_06110 [Gemmatimonadota bacterium]